MASHACAAEIASNGLGGGAWSDPATWRGKSVPGPSDDVVIQKNDVVVFDRSDDGKPTCKKLLIDPRGGLTFKTGGGNLTLAVTDGIESFGVVRLDGTKSASDFFELKLIGDTASKRQIKLGKNAALLLYGKASLPEGKRNVALVAPHVESKEKEAIFGLVDAEGQVMIDWLRADIHDVKLQAKKIDNTGAKPGERIKVSECRFTGQARIWTQTCDTPEIVKCDFENKGKPIEEAAINVSFSPLAEIRENTVRGGFAVGITVNYQSDSVLIGNTVENCTSGITGGYGIPNTMIKQTRIRGCATGFKLEGGSGVLEDILVEGATTAFHEQNSSFQLTQFIVKDLAPKTGMAVLHEGNTLTLMNCNILPGQIKLGPQGAKPAPVPVACLQHLVVVVKGAPAGALVDVRTTNPPAAAGAADPNVRNSPAPLVDGQTPPAGSLGPLIVKAWSLDPAGKTVAAPEYAIKILGPLAKEGAERPVLKTVAYRPTENTFRAADDKKPTMEVTLP